MVAPETNCASRAAPTTVGSDFGKYKLLAEIGRGGMGEVYLAMSRGPSGFKKLVVVKCLHATSADDESLRTMFLDEGVIAARLSHQNVVQTHEIGELNGTLYMAMEFLDGQPLSRLTRTRPGLRPPLAAHVVANALAGLHYAHELCDFDGTHLEIVHRDLSPPNIFITYDGVVKVVDFGIAKTALMSRAKTEIGILKGKVAYMAPEQATQDDVDRRADIFSLGVVLWEIVAGRRLFGGASTAVTLKRLLQDEIPRISSVQPEVDPMLDDIVARALQRDLDARYPNALEMAQDLEKYLKSGAAVPGERELGKLVSERFAGERRKMRQQVQACIREEPASVAGLPRMTTSEPPSSPLPVMAGPSPAQLPTVAGDFRPAAAYAERSNAPQAPVPVSWRLVLLAAGFALGLTGFVRNWIVDQSADIADHPRRIEPTRPAAASTPVTAAIRAEAGDGVTAPSAEADGPERSDDKVTPPPAAENVLHSATAPRTRMRVRTAPRDTKPFAQTAAMLSSGAELRERSHGGAQSVRVASKARSSVAPEPYLKTRARLVPDLPRSKLVE